MIYININGEEISPAPNFMQKIFAECDFIMEMGRYDCLVTKNGKIYKIDFSMFIKTQGNDINDLITYLKKRYEEI